MTEWCQVADSTVITDLAIMRFPTTGHNQTCMEACTNTIRGSLSWGARNTPLAFTKFATAFPTPQSPISQKMSVALSSPMPPFQ